jgi:hypothetical protein
MSNRSLFVISLDFELYWGMFDKVPLEKYGANIRGVHSSIPEMLAVFKLHGIHATWATVGMLMCDSRDALLSILPNEAHRPVYDDMNASSYEHIRSGAVGENNTDDPYHYGSHLVEKIIQTPHQELASHTFSHYYCIDGSKNSDVIFAADCEAFKKASAPFNRTITSIVFPRNQTTPSALKVCKDAALTAYRGTPNHFLYTAKGEAAQTNIFLRALRLLDAYINISGHHTYTLSSANDAQAPLTNIPASRFLRPHSSRLSFLEPMRIKRIKDSMTHAAQNDEIYHLWWHPHNFGINRKENLAHLLEILEHYRLLKDTYGMKSATMQEAAISVIE